MIEKTYDLADVARAVGISTTSDLYALFLKLSPTEAALFRALFNADAPVSTFELRAGSAGLLGHISLTARGLNAKLAAAGDARRAVHRRISGRTRGDSSLWSLSKPEAGAA